MYSLIVPHNRETVREAEWQTMPSSYTVVQTLLSVTEINVLVADT